MFTTSLSGKEHFIFLKNKRGLPSHMINFALFLKFCLAFTSLLVNTFNKINIKTGISFFSGLKTD